MNASNASLPTPNLESLRKAIQEYQPNLSRVPFSNLKPFHDAIVELRGKKASYAVIAELLNQNGVKTSRARVAEYGRIVLAGGKTRKRRRQRRIMLPPAPPVMPVTAPKPQISLAMDEPSSAQNRPRGPRIARVRLLDGTIAGERSPGQRP
jgi:hypothetical protein